MARYIRAPRTREIAGLILVLVTLISLGHLADFLLGARGQRSVKDKLVDTYVGIAEGDWSEAFRVPARQVRHYIDIVFAWAGTTPQFAHRVGLYSLAMSFGIDVALWSLDWRAYPNVLVIPLFPSGAPAWHVALVAVGVATNFWLDLASFSILAVVCRLILPAKSFLIPVIVIILSAAIYTLFWLSFLIGSVLLSVVVSIVFDVFPFTVDTYLSLVPIVSDTALFYYLHPSQLFGQMLPSMVINLQVVVPLTLYVTLVFFSYVISLLRPVAKAPILLVLERLEESKSGVFTAVAAGLSALVALLTAIAKWAVLPH
jgi:hypothetical protein